MSDELVNEAVLYGLTDDEVSKRVAAGLVNANTEVKTKSIGQIVAEHTFTLFNIVNVILAVLVIITGEYRNMAFMGVVFFNLIVGITQEIRAKLMVDRLTILTSKRVTVIRASKRVDIPVEEIVKGDIVLLSHGDQVPADGKVISGEPLVDESLLTGESDSIEKHAGDVLYSGSFVVSGNVAYRVDHVGMEGYAARINAEARYVKPVNSEILRTLKMIIELATVLLVPLGIGLFLRTYFSGEPDLFAAILSTVAAVVGMIPQGLVLLTSSVLAIATTILGRRSVLVQQSYCVETLARIDTLCLDKTGTITSGAMEVTNVCPAEGSSRHDVETVLTTITTANADDANETARALLAYAEKNSIDPLAVTRTVPFSSARKYSGCVTEDGRAFVMGAAQFILGEKIANYRSSLDQFGERERVLTLAELDGFGEKGELLGVPHVLGFVALRDEIRETAADTIKFFYDQGVDLKVISGDDPRTVAAIAKAVGIRGAEHPIDATTLATDEDLAQAVRANSVFGRVTPQQKRSLVRALHADGHTVAMTGDGVNDVLALKEADCSVSMASGSAAARNISEIVLVDNDFSHMPEVVAEGRRSINNLQRSASLFLVKTVFSALLALVCIVLPPYPFIPIQMTLLSSAVIGWPSFVLSLEPNHERVTGNFLANVLKRSLPASIAIVAAALAVQIGRGLFGFTDAEVSTCSLYLSAAVGFALLVRISRPLNPLRSALLVSVLGVLVVGCVGFPGFFKLAPMTVTMALFLVICGVGALALFNTLYVRLNDRADAEGVLASLVQRVEHIYSSRGTAQ